MHTLFRLTADGDDGTGADLGFIMTVGGGGFGILALGEGKGFVRLGAGRTGLDKPVDTTIGFVTPEGSVLVNVGTGTLLVLTKSNDPLIATLLGLLITGNEGQLVGFTTGLSALTIVVAIPPGRAGGTVTGRGGGGECDTIAGVLVGTIGSDGRLVVLARFSQGSPVSSSLTSICTLKIRKINLE